MKLGEILMEAGVIGAPDVARGLARQRLTGARLGATLVDLGAVTADEVARALARQHGVPAALERHLAGRDHALAARLPADVARRLWALPVAVSRGADGHNLVVCLRDPTADAVAAVRAASGLAIIPAVACERSLRRELDAAYPVDDGSVDIVVDEPSQPLFAGLGELALVGLDDVGVAKDHSQNLGGNAPAIGLAAAGAESRRHTASNPAIPLPAEPAVAPAPAAPPAPPPLALDEALARIAVAASADQVNELALNCLRGAWMAALILIVRDKDKLALGQHGFGGSLTPATVEAIVVPLDQPSVLRTAHDDRRPFLGDAPPGAIAQERFMRLFSELHSRTVAVAPVLVRERPAALVLAVAPLTSAAEAGAIVPTLARAMGEAYLRLILAHKQKR